MTAPPLSALPTSVTSPSQSPNWSSARSTPSHSYPKSALQTGNAINQQKETEDDKPPVCHTERATSAHIAELFCVEWISLHLLIGKERDEGSYCWSPNKWKPTFFLTQQYPTLRMFFFCVCCGGFAIRYCLVSGFSIRQH